MGSNEVEYTTQRRGLPKGVVTNASYCEKQHDAPSSPSAV